MIHRKVVQNITCLQQESWIEYNLPKALVSNGTNYHPKILFDDISAIIDFVNSRNESRFADIM